MKCPFCLDKEPTQKNTLFKHINGAHYKDVSPGEKFTQTEILKGIKGSKLPEEIKSYLSNKFDINEPPEGGPKQPENIDDFNNGYLLDNYLDKENPICREERQYAHYLANKLQNNDPTILKALGLSNFIVQEVYYEATFMRDLWKANGNKFNEIYYKYLIESEIVDKHRCNEDNLIRDINLKRRDVNPNYWLQKPAYVKWLMNAKPDIAVLYKQDDNYKLIFIECKYLSETDEYRKDDLRLKQIKAQECILYFLCNYLKIKYKGNRVKSDGVKLVQFISNNMPTKWKNKRKTRSNEYKSIEKEIAISLLR